MQQAEKQAAHDLAGALIRQNTMEFVETTAEALQAYAMNCVSATEAFECIAYEFYAMKSANDRLLRCAS